MDILKQYFNSYSSELRRLDRNICCYTVDQLSSRDCALGSLKHCFAVFAIVRHSGMWYAPRTAPSIAQLDSTKNAIALLLQVSETEHICVSGGLDRFMNVSFTHSDNTIVVSCVNDSKQRQDCPVVLTIAPSPYEALNKCFEVAVGWALGSKPQLPVSTSPLQRAASCDLGYCTWNGLGGVNVTFDALVNVLENLENINVRPGTVIIDDGWQDTAGDRKLCSFRANTKKFPLGLKGSVAELKQRFPFIENVGVWCTINGYWNGIFPGSELDSQYKTINTNTGLIVDPDCAFRFFDDLFRYLVDCGVSLVKMDNQVVFSWVDSPQVRSDLWNTHCHIVAHLGQKYFGANFIYCMSMQPNLLSFVPTWGQRQQQVVPILRNSDDFFPNIAESHAWHVYTNFCNSLYTRHLRCFLDFDMFQSKPAPSAHAPEQASALHAAARCLSGGPIYITDSPEYHDSQLLHQISCSKGRNSRSADFILQFPQPPTSMSIYTPFGARKLHWVFNRSATGKGNRFSLVVAAFNFCQEVVGEDVAIKIRNAVEMIGYSQKYLVRSHKSSALVDFNSPYRCLAPLECDIFTLAPVTQLSSRLGNASIACFGIASHLVGILALSNWEVAEYDSYCSASLQVSAPGYCAIYTSKCPKKIEVTPNRPFVIKGHFIEVCFDPDSAYGLMDTTICKLYF